MGVRHERGGNVASLLTYLHWDQGIRTTYTHILPDLTYFVLKQSTSNLRCKHRSRDRLRYLNSSKMSSFNIHPVNRFDGSSASIRRPKVRIHISNKCDYDRMTNLLIAGDHLLLIRR